MFSIVKKEMSMLRSMATVATAKMSVVGPLKVNGREYLVPLASSDSTLLSRLNRGCRAIEETNGIRVQSSEDSMVFTPTLVLKDMQTAVKFSNLIGERATCDALKVSFEAATGKSLSSISCQLMGRRAFVRLSVKLEGESLQNLTEAHIQELLSPLQDLVQSPIELSAAVVRGSEETARNVTSSVFIPSDIVESILHTRYENAQSIVQEKKGLKGHIVDGVYSRRTVASIIQAVGLKVVEPADLHPLSSFSMNQVACASAEEWKGILVSCTIPKIVTAKIGDVSSACANPLQLSADFDEVKFSQIMCAAVLAGEVGSISSANASESVSPYRISIRKPLSTKRTAMKSPPPPEAARGVSSFGGQALKTSKTQTNAAYIDLVAEKCAAEFGWADPRLTVP